MARPNHETEPCLLFSLHGHFRLTYLPVIDEDKQHGAIVVLADGTPVIVATGFPTSHVAWAACQNALEAEIFSLATGYSIYPLLHEWKHVPTEAEEIAAFYRATFVGLPSIIPINDEIVKERLRLDAESGFVELLTTITAAQRLGISRQAVFSRLKRMSLTNIKLSREPNRTFCLASEVEAIAGRPLELRNKYVQLI